MPTDTTAVSPIPASQLAAATPAEVDERLGEIWTRYYAADDLIVTQLHYADDYRSRLAQAAAGTYRYAYRDSDRSRDESALAKLEAKVAELRAQAATILREADPYEDEFVRRGGWTRAYLVTSHGGHVHKSRTCDTCFVTTRFVWITTLSGRDENTIVDLAGEAACTRCYPSAPVAVLQQQTRIFDPAETARRNQRAEDKQARDATKEANAIANPDGTPIRLRGYGRVATARAAELEYVRLGVNVLEVDHYGQGQHMKGEYQADMAVLLTALAHKRHSTEESVQTELAPKIKAKFKRDNR